MDPMEISCLILLAIMLYAAYRRVSFTIRANKTFANLEEPRRLAILTAFQHEEAHKYYYPLIGLRVSSSKIPTSSELFYEPSSAEAEGVFVSMRNLKRLLSEPFDREVSV